MKSKKKNNTLLELSVDYWVLTLATGRLIIIITIIIITIDRWKD